SRAPWRPDGDGFMKNLRLRTKLALVIAVLAAAVLAVATVGYFQLAAVNDRLQRMVEVTAKEANPNALIRLHLQPMRRNVLDAALTVDDEQSRACADEARQVARQVEQARKELADMIERNPTGEDRRMLEEFTRSWEEFQQLEKQSLALAVQNSNYKAHLLLRG